MTDIFKSIFLCHDDDGLSFIDDVRVLCWLVCGPKGYKNLRCTLCRSMYWFSFQLAIIVDRYYPHFIRYAPSTRITAQGEDYKNKDFGIF